MYIQHDGAPAHYAASVRACLDTTFRDRWIGRGGPVSWPPGPVSLAFFFWGHLKTAVYQTPVETREEVVARIHGAVATITGDTLLKVQQNVRRRAETCLEVQGGYIESVLVTLN